MAILCRTACEASVLHDASGLLGGLGKSGNFEAASAWIHHLGVSIKCIGVIGAILNRQTLRNRHHKPAPQQQPWPH